ncbi:MAG: nucleotide exchange factor GrpE [Eubacteriales bacterium]|nr:nucleotide exchange factor GrpE [Eubacteriales bacterium]MCI6971964.1 nucleotide exchange factor GrpE [Eubacterium sp.]MDD7572633.1 nucleotide exchange factor GrpE [Eubacteriales bacterium]
MDEKKIETEEKKTSEEHKASTGSEKKELSKLKGEVKKLTGELEGKSKAYDELNDKYLRMMAEYDNFRKRSQRERDGIYASAYEEALKEFLPMSDNLQRSLAYAGTENFAKGIEMIVNQFSDTLKKLGIEEYGKRGDPFDPNIHNAVMRTDDDSLGENTVAEVLQKGYRKGDKILRFAMVKVAN